jgi:catechol 2,3-dioxygenase-like lactoylglutathione lyase family enzyme
MTTELTIAQVAFVGVEVGVRDAVAWYSDVLGFRPSGGLTVEGGPSEADFLGVSDDPKLEMGWLVDQTDVFQLELYEFDQPRGRPKPSTWTPRDIGYSLATIWVGDFDGAVSRALATGSLVTEPAGIDGDRRAVVVDPNGNLIELMERDPLGDRPIVPTRPAVAVRGLRASVADLDKSIAFFGDGFGLEPIADPHRLHRPEHEASWGLVGETPALVTFRAGDLFLELARYDSPGAPPSADRLVSDAGIMNFALTTQDKAVYERVAERMEERGCRVRKATMNDDVSLAYITDGDGFGVELLFMAPAAYGDFGFWPAQE